LNRWLVAQLLTVLLASSAGCGESDGVTRPRFIQPEFTRTPVGEWMNYPRLPQISLRIDEEGIWSATVEQKARTPVPHACCRDTALCPADRLDFTGASNVDTTANYLGLWADTTSSIEKSGTSTLGGCRSAATRSTSASSMTRVR